MEENIQRQTAYKVRLDALRNGQYTRQEGWNPNYIELGNKQVSRINVVGIIVSRDEQSVLLDDGFGRMTLRSFEEENVFSGIEIGSCVLVVGRPREYNGDIYIVPEIIKATDRKWMEVRQEELKEESVPQKTESVPEKKEEEIVIEDVQESSADRIIGLIKELDKGDGADIEQIIEASGMDNCEESVRRLISSGDIFELKPGRVKVLE